VYPDTLFLFFVALFLLGGVRWVRTQSNSSTALIGIGLAGAAFCRILVAPWVAAILIFLVVVAALRRRLSLRAIAQLSRRRQPNVL